MLAKLYPKTSYKNSLENFNIDFFLQILSIRHGFVLSIRHDDLVVEKYVLLRGPTHQDFKKYVI